MKIEEKLNNSIWPHFLNSLDKTEVNQYGVINRNWSIASCTNIEKRMLDKFQFESKKWLHNYLSSNSSKNNLALYGGLCDLASSFRRANEKFSFYEEEMKILNQEIYILLEKRIELLNSQIDDIAEHEFDTISGLAGIVNYCFQNDSFFHDLNEKILKIFILKSNSETGWKIQNRYLDEAYRKTFPCGYINLSISHGVLGPLISMSHALEIGYKIDGLEDSVKKIMKLYEMYFDMKSGKIPCIVDVSNEKKNVFYNRDSWSYGSAVIFFGLMKASKLVRDDKSYCIYRKALLDRLVLGNDFDKWGFVSPTLLNGYSGILCLLKKLTGCSQSIEKY